MKKMLIIFLSITLCIGTLSAQAIDGNYTLDSLTVQYVMVTRDMNQQDSDGNTVVAAADAAQANYGLRVRFPSNADMEWEYELPLFNPGDTIRVQNVALPSAAWLAGAGISMNVDFTSGAYTFNEGSTYPTTQTVDCVTAPVNPAIQDQGTWTDAGDGDGLVHENPNWIKNGWGIITSGVFASFDAPNMNTDVYGTNYGVGTTMEDWGYMKTSYNDDWSQPTGLNLGWEAHDGPDAGIGVVSPGDQYYSEEEEAWGLLNNVVGLASLPVDSVTIPGMAQLALAPTITVPTPAGPYTYDNDAAGVDVYAPDNMAYMFNGPGAIDPATGATVIDTETGNPQGQFDGNKAYIFDPTGALIGGGDGLPYSGDEGLKFTGYYATWNTLMTIKAMQHGLTMALMNGDFTAAGIADSILDAVIYQWDIDTDSLYSIASGAVATGTLAAFTQTLTEYITAFSAGSTPTVASITQAVAACMPTVMGALTSIEANYLGLFETWEGDTITVNDSWTDLESEYWTWWGDDSTDASGNPLPVFGPTGLPNGTYIGGGRMFVELDANCIPARWSQYIDSHWTYSGTIAGVDEGIVAEKFEIKGNYPNPFNPMTKIRFSNDRTANVRVHVYSLLGERVNTLINKQLNSGTYDITWNGMNSHGKVVPSGMYLYEVESEGRRLQGKMLFLK